MVKLKFKDFVKIIILLNLQLHKCTEKHKIQCHIAENEKINEVFKIKKKITVKNSFSYFFA